MFRRLLVVLLATIGLAVLTACGSSDLGQLLTGVQVEEELADGSLRPVAGANVRYQIISNSRGFTRCFFCRATRDLFKY